jgi:autotransporter passenger strand-loop-strand repeat protein
MTGTLSGYEVITDSSGYNFGGSNNQSGYDAHDSDTTIVSGGLEILGIVFGTGYATGTIIDAGGVQSVGGSGGGHGYATSTTINSGGSQVVGGFGSGKGYATSTTINSGGSQIVGDSGGTGYATSTTILGGTQIVGGPVYSGEIDLGFGPYEGTLPSTGYALSTTVDSSGAQYVGYSQGTGYATSTTLVNGGAQYVGYSGGTGYATSTTIESGGSQFVGGSQYVELEVPIPGESIYNYYESLGEGFATGTIVEGGGAQFVGNADGYGTAVNTVIDSGGSQYLGSGADASHGTAISTTISSYGAQYVGISGGTGVATSTTVGSDAAQFVGESGGRGFATSTTVAGGGYQYVGYDSGSGSAVSTVIDSGGAQYLGYGASGEGTGTSTTISSYGTQYLGVSGGTGVATSTTIGMFAAQIVGSFGGGTAISTTINFLGGQYLGVGTSGSGTASDTTINSKGAQYVGYSGGTGNAVSTTVNSGGFQFDGAYSGGSGYATSTTVSGGGTQYIGYDGGTGYATSTTLSGGTQYVGYGGAGYATATSVHAGGDQIVTSQGAATSTVVFSGGLADVQSGGIVDGPAIDGGTLELEQGAIVGAGPIDFASGVSGSLLEVFGLSSGGALNAAISGFTSGDTILVEGFTATAHSYASGAGLVLSGGAETVTIDLIGNYTGDPFQVSNTANGAEVMLCYLHGTRIITPTGQAAVEDLRIGDAVVTRFGGIQSIKWLGRQAYAPRFIANNPEKWPVCIHAGALGNGMPSRDLYVSPGHSMLLGETLVLASNLVNGITITQSPPERQVNYVQIELGRHDCVVAEGAWSETYADGPGLRAQFHNAAEYETLFPDEPPPEGLRLCAERPERGPKLAAALMPVVSRAASGVAPGKLEGYIDFAGDWRVEGWARDLANPELPVPLVIMAGGQSIGLALACDFREDLRQASKGRGHCAFSFTPPFRLRADALATLAIRRAADGAEVPGMERFRPQPEPARPRPIRSVQPATAASATVG